MGTTYVPDGSRGVRYDDPRSGSSGLTRRAVISERDRTYPDLSRVRVQTMAEP